MAPQSNVRNLQPFDFAIVKRSTITKHPRNPKKMSMSQRARLNNGLDEFGMIEPFVKNKRTGNLVSGHGRIDWMDDQYFGEDYDVKVAIVDVAPEKELTLITLLSNRSAQGEFDDDILADLLRSDEIDSMLAGFEKDDLKELLAPTAEVEKMDDQPPPQMIWTLIGVPFNRFDEVQDLIAKLEEVSGITVQSSRNK